ncbi:MAG: hypothetical protein LBH74_06945 [Nitrososphaerota archaeon]|nr:hypothetical protein [Nitrososphaerota archaeon]
MGSHSLSLYTVDVNGGLQATQTIHGTTKMTNRETLTFVLATVSITSLIICLKLLIHHKTTIEQNNRNTHHHLAGLRVEQKGVQTTHR